MQRPDPRLCSFTPGLVTRPCSIDPQRPDPRLRWFTPGQIKFVDSLGPVLRASGLAKEARRLGECGTKYNLLKCSLNGNHDPVLFRFPYRCEQRVCPRCTRKRGHEVRRDAEAITRNIRKTRTRKFGMLSLTLKKYPDKPLRPSDVKRLNRCVHQLMNDFFPKSRGCGAIWTDEIGPSMNLHAHAMVYGPWVDESVLSKRWLAITGDSFIVRIRASRDQKNAIDYITKYIGKPPRFESLQDYVSFVRAFKGVRRLHRSGIFYGASPDSEKSHPLLCPYCGDRLIYDGTTRASGIETFTENYWEACDLIEAAVSK